MRYAAVQNGFSNWSKWKQLVKYEILNVGENLDHGFLGCDILGSFKTSVTTWTVISGNSFYYISVVYEVIVYVRLHGVRTQKTTVQNL